LEGAAESRQPAGKLESTLEKRVKFAYNGAWRSPNLAQPFRSSIAIDPNGFANNGLWPLRTSTRQEGLALQCISSPLSPLHSLRATTATLLLDAGVDNIKVKELFGHRRVTATRLYDKRRRGLKEGASHDVPI
jgi:integrase